MSSMHKRKSSKEDTRDCLAAHQNVAPELANPPPVPALSVPPSPPRSRVRSTPSSVAAQPASGITTRSSAPPPPLGAGIPAVRAPSISLNSPPTSPFRTSFTAQNPNTHSRARSISSGPFVPPVPSPLSSTFPQHIPLHPFPFPTSSTIPDLSRSDSGTVTTNAPPGHTRRHSRLHSRNLSIFFPRPHATISEDDRPLDEEAPAPPPLPVLIPASRSEPTLEHGAQVGRELNATFTFGGMPKSDSESNDIRRPSNGITARRGHHHKHSVSHNFFSFLEPGQSQTLTVPNKEELVGELHTAPPSTPISPWSPISNASLFASPNLSVAELIPRSHSKSPAASLSSSHSPSPLPSSITIQTEQVPPSGSLAKCVAFGQFVLGALLWMRGQSIGSLACTGVGYWVVFDAVGVAGPAIIAYQVKVKGKGMYGPARRGTTLLFAQCVYLMFAAVYVAKEAIEHLLLSAGGGVQGHDGGGSMTAGKGGDGHHHHHWGDEKPETLGLRFPVFLILAVLLSLASTSVVFGQHEVLVGITNKYIPYPPLWLFRRGGRHTTQSNSNSMQRIGRNPYTLPPIIFCLAILGAEMVLDVAHYAPFDLALAAVQVVVTAYVAYAACVALGGVLLQTAPPIAPSTMRGGVVPLGATSLGPAGRMEAFWKVVREIERHEHVLHLPAPHVWQVVAPGQPRSVGLPSSNGHTSLSGSPRNQDPNHHHNGQVHQTHQQSRTYPRSDHDDSPGVCTTISPALIVTLSPHVHRDLADTDMLALTQWASTRVYNAFSKAGSGKEIETGAVEVTVGVIRG
ncbi:hypothetical protein F5I97DRAFT_1831931 [Phlebopus sp. FC_14]|nr:hypothetical protein F5I97DRAFT_1831931 [Phlebopus sp. FC_14]